MSESLNLPVLPLDDEVVLPGMVVPLDLSDTEVRAAIDAAQALGEKKPQVLLVPRIDGRYGAVGVRAVVEQVGRLPGGEPAAVVRGVDRVRVGAGTTGPGAALWVQTIRVEPVEAGERAEELAKEYKALATTILQKRGAWQVVDAVNAMSDPSVLADNSGYAPWLTTPRKVEILETADPAGRLEKLVEWAREHLAELDVAETIRKDVQEGMEKQQREFLLRQQLAAVRKELAELDGSSPETEEEDYRARVEAADLPEKVREAALKEVGKLERTSDQSPETGWIRTWLDTVLDIPWNVRTEERRAEGAPEGTVDIAAAREVLDADHTGLDDVKDRIIEYLAVRGRRAQQGLGVVGGRRSGAVLALAGPPGVGKTSLGESVARAMGRKFVRVALGGVRDEAEIRGHRRTYVGAQSGRIVRAIREAGSMNPVVLLDEIDKVGSDYRGDPTAALLEVLDPAQNHTFRDHYLEVELDLSDVLFLATANVLEAIPGPLLDRMEVVTLDGYTEDEKVAIARDHLLPRQLEKAGLSAADVAVGEDVLRRLASEYTREAGVRSLERSIARVLRKVTAQAALGEAELPVTVDDLVPYLGRPRHVPESSLPESRQRTAVPGVATGLAVTGAGGDVLYVEASLADPETGATGLTLTGQLGDVMKESAQIALSYLRSRGAELELPVSSLKDRSVHIHFPAGAVPKDGPSAGVTMTTALASLLSGRPVRNDVAMTGEISLTGRVLPIGGVKQKLLAAHRAGITTVLIPARNEPDLDDVPEAVLGELTVHAVSDVREVLEIALTPAKVAEPAAA
ncbi:Lon protease [Planomonospora parontospora subsp. parontospora]|uniref:Lon protease n=2 Tax=Planomonospora parontospora TaxID=58119 RepID=A0AA37BLU5_9ACTN|nr:endopeptidase La [Planomonospora parontospora]GGK88236.1 Lon protease [Planomonospora parontospora]GII11537.1 Lon protease [Planomonospora parontospora subsp. parontospora]